MGFLLVNIHATFFRLFEWMRVVVRYYRKLPFLWGDVLLGSHYLWRNPHQVSKAFMKARGEKNLYTYGETPLTTLDRIARECGILSKDTVFEVGCGSGRTLFWLHHFVRCQAVGVDYQPTFIQRADRVKQWLHLDQTQFLCADMLEVDFHRATVLYLYGTSLEEETIERLVKKFERLKKGTKIITVSYPLTEYSSSFTVAKQFSARFPWGKAEVFLNVLNTHDAVRH